MSERLERLKDELLAIVDGEPVAETGRDTEFKTLFEAARRLPADFDKPAWSLMTDEEVALPEMIGSYRILGTLGRGGMGVVYRAEQAAPLSREIALKVIRPHLATKSSLARFELERSILARLCHPNIAAVLESGTRSNGQPFVAMELVDGRSVTEYATQHRLSLRERLEVFLQICDGIAHAHARGVIHRDLKPGNVLVTNLDGRPIPKIIDFGIARIVDLDWETRLTFSDQLLGTLEYMSPEVIEQGASVADARSDVYALGAILYELVVGTPAVTLESTRNGGIGGLLKEVQEATIPRPADRIREAPNEHSVRAIEIGADLNCVILHALERDPNDRYQSPRELASDVEHYLANRPIVANPPSTAKVVSKFVLRNRLAVAGAIAMTLSLVAAFVASVVGYVRVERSRQAAVEAREQGEEAVALLSQAVLLSNTRDPRVRIELAKLGDRIESMLAKNDVRSPAVRLRLQIMLANAYAANNQFERANTLLRELTRTTDELAMPSEHFQTLKMLAENQTHLRQDAAALSTAREARDAARENEDGRQQKAARFVLANALVTSGRLAEAEAIYQAILSEKPSGKDANSQIAHAEAQVMYATVLIRVGRADEAERHAREGYATYRQHYGLTTTNALMAGQNLGAILTAAGKHDEAIVTFRPILAARKDILGQDHPDTLTTCAMLGRALIAAGQDEEGELVLKEALRIGNATHQDRNPVGILVCKSLAYFYSERQNHAASIRAAKDCIRFAEASFEEGDWRIEIQRTRLAGLHHKAGNFEEALALSTRSHRVIADAVGNEHPYAKAAAKTVKAAREELDASQ